MRSLLITMPALFLCSCSLVGLSNFEIPICENNTQCAPLNDAEGITDPDACMQYQCRQGACILDAKDIDGDSLVDVACADTLPECGVTLDCSDCADDDEDIGALDETCDGLDNDCDGIIDEDAVATVDGIIGNAMGIAPDLVAGSNDGMGQVHYVVDTEGRSLGISRVGTDGPFFDVLAALPADAALQGQSIDYVRSSDLSPAGFMDASIEAGCPGLVTFEVPAPTSPVVGANPPTTCETHAECDDGTFCNGWETCEPRSPLSNAFGCREAMGDPCAGSEATCDEAARLCARAAGATCQMADVAAAGLGGGEWLTATITATGCDRGRVLIGYQSEQAISPSGDIPGPNVLLRGDAGRSTSYLGTDVDGDRCTGASRAAEELRGASSINVAALAPAPSMPSPRRRPQGLVAWLAAPLCRGAADDTDRAACDGAGASAPVEVLGVFQEAGGAGGTTVKWINATNDGRPQRLTEAASGYGRPAISAVADEDWAGYLVAYGRDGGGIAIQSVTAPPDPAEVSEFEPYISTVSSAPPRTTPALAAFGTATTLPGGGGATAAVDRLQLARVGLADGRSILGLAWVEADGVWFATLELSTATGAPVLAPAFSPLRIGMTRAVNGLSIAHMSNGIYAPDPENPEALLGGFFIVWSEAGGADGSRLRAVRIPDRSGAPLLDEPAVLADGLAFSNPTVVFANSAAESPPRPRPQVIAHDGEAGEFVALRGVCGQAP